MSSYFGYKKLGRKPASLRVGNAPHSDMSFDDSDMDGFPAEGEGHEDEIAGFISLPWEDGEPVACGRSFDAWHT